MWSAWRSLTAQVAASNGSGRFPQRPTGLSLVWARSHRAVRARCRGTWGKNSGLSAHDALPEAAEYASFAFATQQEAIRALSAIGRSGYCEEAYLFDPATTQRSLDPSTLVKDIERLGNVIRAQSSVLKGLREGAKMAVAGRRLGGVCLYASLRLRGSLYRRRER